MAAARELWPVAERDDIQTVASRRLRTDAERPADRLGYTQPPPLIAALTLLAAAANAALNAPNRKYARFLVAADGSVIFKRRPPVVAWPTATRLVFSMRLLSGDEARGCALAFLVGIFVVFVCHDGQ